MSAFGNQSVEIPCPKCGRKHTKRISGLNANTQIRCSCGANIDVDASELKKGLASVDKALKDLQRSFNKTFKI